MRRLPCLLAFTLSLGCALSFGLAWPVAAEERFDTWPVLQSTFPSTGGGGIFIKGYDPVVTGTTCTTTFMAVDPSGETPKVYPNVVTFEAIAVQGGTLCHNGKWRSFDGTAEGTTPFRVFFKDGVVRGQP